MSFFISFIQRAALSQWEFCEQKWCHFSSDGFQVVPLDGLHYLNMKFVNKSDVIFHQFHSKSCTISVGILWTKVMSFFIRRIPGCSTRWAALSQYEVCEQERCHFSSVSFKELHYLSGNFVNKSDVIFHHQDFRLFHLVSCTVSTWTLWTRLMSFFIRRIPDCSIEWAAISLYKFCEQRVVSFFIRRIPDCSTKWAALSQYEVCEQERCHFSSVSFKELHYLSGNFVNKSDVIFHHQDFRLFHIVSCKWHQSCSQSSCWHELCEQDWCHFSSEGFQIVPLNELQYLNLNFVNRNDLHYLNVNFVNRCFHQDASLFH